MIVNANNNIFNACRSGDVGKVKSLVASKKLDVNFSTFSQFKGELPLSIAAQKGYVEIVKILIDAKANVNAMINNSQKSILSTAVENGQIEIVKILIEAKAIINYVNGFSARGCKVPFHIACEKGEIEMVKLLIQSEASMSDSKSDGYCNHTALTQAVLHNHIEIIGLLIDSKCDVNEVIGGDFSLSLAAQLGNSKIVKILLEGKAVVQHKNKYYGVASNPIIFSVARSGNIESAKLLIEAKVDVNVNSQGHGITALEAASVDNIDMEKLIIESKGDLSHILLNNDEFSKTIYLAILYGDIVKLKNVIKSQKTSPSMDQLINNMQQPYIWLLELNILI